MKKNLFFILPIIGIVGFSFFYEGDHISTYHNDGIEAVNFTSDPPTGKTGAPGEGNCTDCHSGSTMSGDGVVFFTVGGGPGYIPGSTYPITVSTISGTKNGFEMTILDGDDNFQGSFTSGDNSGVATGGGIDYVRHSASDGVLSWTFDWTAPAADAGELTAYYTVNISNDNGSSSGDEIFLGNESIPLFGVGIEENELDAAYNIFYNSQTRELNLNYSLLKESKVVLNIQDLSGKLIQYYDFGYQNQGDYAEKLTVTNVDSEGIYLLSLFINNQVFNRKVSLN
ncbi:MAG: hypothetical protein GQ574_20115 [Crocinitomix sp.]|nr:hypothetical protein [Crocinitomix sp.]